MISSAYTPGTAVDVAMEAKLMVSSTCTGTCKFTYISQGLSPNLTAISSTSVFTEAITLTGQNLIDGSNFAEVTLTNKETGNLYVLSSTSSSSTSVTFETTSNIISGIYLVRVRNAIGQSNSL